MSGRFLHSASTNSEHWHTVRLGIWSMSLSLSTTKTTMFCISKSDLWHVIILKFDRKRTWMFVYVVSFAFFAGGSVGSLDGVLLDDSLGVQGDDMVLNG